MNVADTVQGDSNVEWLSSFDFDSDFETFFEVLNGFLEFGLVLVNVSDPVQSHRNFHRILAHEFGSDLETLFVVIESLEIIFLTEIRHTHVQKYGWAFHWVLAEEAGLYLKWLLVILQCLRVFSHAPVHFADFHENTGVWKTICSLNLCADFHAGFEAFQGLRVIAQAVVCLSYALNVFCRIQEVIFGLFMGVFNFLANQKTLKAFLNFILFL